MPRTEETRGVNFRKYAVALKDALGTAASRAERRRSLLPWLRSRLSRWKRYWQRPVFMRHSNTITAAWRFGAGEDFRKNCEAASTPATKRKSHFLAHTEAAAAGSDALAGDALRYRMPRFYKYSAVLRKAQVTVSQWEGWQDSGPALEIVISCAICGDAASARSSRRVSGGRRSRVHAVPRELSRCARHTQYIPVIGKRQCHFFAIKGIHLARDLRWCRVD